MPIDLAHYAYDYDIVLSAHARNKLVLLVLSQIPPSYMYVQA